METNTPNVEDRNRQPLIEGLLRDIARKRATALRWNTHTMLLFYALLFIVALLRFEGVNIFIIVGIASLGLLVLWIMSRIRWKKLEKIIYEEELGNYHKLINLESNSISIETGKPGDSPLSERELEVLTRIAEGLINKQIAVALGISTQTVKNHISHILTKLDVDDRTTAVLLAVSRGWISLSSRDNGKIKKDITKAQPDGS